MAPKVKVTRQAVLDAGLELVRKAGENALNARNLAAALGCSTQPVFTHFASMEQLRLALVVEAGRLCHSYMEQEIAEKKYPPYKASGMAYIRFARQERNLFQLLYMRDRSGEQEVPDQFLWDVGVDLAGQAVDRELDQLVGFHMEMWAIVHGFATMAATGFLPLEEDAISAMITDVFQGLKKQHGEV